MNTKLNNAQINPEFEDLFSYKSTEEKIEHNAQMISYRILSEVEKVCEQKKIKKKDLADKVGTSRSYITQLFRGSKQVNTQIMARFEEALNISFQVRVKLNETSEADFMAQQIPVDFFRCNRRFNVHDCVMYVFKGGKEIDRTNEIMNLMKTENTLIQKAG